MMTQANPFLQIVAPRVASTKQKLSAMLWTHKRPVEVSYAGASERTIPLDQAKQLDYEAVSLPFAWGQLFQTGWFHLRFPAEQDGKQRWLLWHDQGEGTLFLGPVPHYGFDVAHRFAPLPAEVQEGWMEGLCLQSAIWHSEARGTTADGSVLTQAVVAERNEAVWQAYHWVDVLYELAKDEAERCMTFAGLREEGSGYRTALETVPVLLRRLMRLLDNAINAFQRDGVAAMLAEFEQAKSWLQQSPSPINAVLTGHAHIDLVWLWPERCGEYKARHTFASMNRLMDLYPEFRFAYSQSASYEAVNSDCPQLLDQVRKRMAEGKWEAVGASYVEMDNLMPCGEALVRAFQVGQDTFRQLLGESSSTLWLPDVFGYAGCLPQIMRQCGVTRFFTTKLTWSTINRFPYSSFIWRGTDGSEVLTHVTQELGYNQVADPKCVRIGADAYLQADVHDAFLQPTGYGDGGGGVTPEMCERVRLMQELSGVPRTTWGRIDDFFADLEQKRALLPHYQGELYLEYHRGTFTTHGDLKAAFRDLERALQAEEAAHALLEQGPVSVHPWKRLIFSQFHDYIPGSSIREVYVEGLPELRQLASDARARAGQLLGEGNCLFNPCPLPRPVWIKNAAASGLVTLPPLSACVPEELEITPCSPATAHGLSLSSDRVKAGFTAEGTISSLIIDGKPIAIQVPLNELWLYPDVPHKYPAWDIDRQTLDLGKPLDSTVTWCPIQATDGVAGLEFKRQVGSNSTLTIRYKLDPAYPVLQIELDVDWQENNALLKAVFPTEYRGRFARFGSPYNSVLRGQQPGDPRDEAMFEACASRWAVVMDDAQSEGLSLVTEAKYGMGSREGCLHLSLVRSVTVTGEQGAGSQVFPEENRPLRPRDPLSDHGKHRIRYALGLYTQEQKRAESAAALADLLYTPCLQASAPQNAGLLAIEGGESLLPAWAKPNTDGSWILRLHEIQGRTGKATLHLAPGWQAARTSLTEDTFTTSNPVIGFKPYEIVSIRIMKSQA